MATWSENTVTVGSWQTTKLPEGHRLITRKLEERDTEFVTALGLAIARQTVCDRKADGNDGQDVALQALAAKTAVHEILDEMWDFYGPRHAEFFQTVRLGARAADVWLAASPTLSERLAA